jgi:hypothetical protein
MAILPRWATGIAYTASTAAGAEGGDARGGWARGLAHWRQLCRSTQCCGSLFSLSVGLLTPRPGLPPSPRFAHPAEAIQASAAGGTATERVMGLDALLRDEAGRVVREGLLALRADPHMFHQVCWRFGGFVFGAAAIRELAARCVLQGSGKPV